MNVWLWEASGPDYSASGVSGDLHSAQRAAAACMADGQADSALVQEAMLDSIEGEYRNIGECWRAHRTVSGATRWHTAPGTS